MENKTEETQVILNKIYRDFCLTLRSSWFQKHKNSELLEFCCRLSDWIENLPTNQTSDETEGTLSCYIESVEVGLKQFKSLPVEVQSTYKKQVIAIKKFMEGAFKNRHSIF